MFSTWLPNEDPAVQDTWSQLDPERRAQVWREYIQVHIDQWPQLVQYTELWTYVEQLCAGACAMWTHVDSEHDWCNT